MPEEQYIGEEKVGWMPQEGSQIDFMQCPFFEVLLAGNRGGGKTDALIMDFAQDVGKGYGADWTGILFRQTYPQLQDVIKKCKKWFYRIFPGVKFNESTTTWTWPGGERLLLRQFMREGDYWNFHGHEYPWIGWEELTNWGDPTGYKSMMSCCRSSSEHKSMPRKVRATTNSYGPGHNWIKHRFQLPNFGCLIEGLIDEDGNQERERFAIQSSLNENKILLKADPSYMASIRSSAKNEAMVQAWIHGSWDIVSGGMFDDVWVSKVHKLRRFPIPLNWEIQRTLDWGSARPFSVGWWAISDGSDVYVDGNVRSTVRGDVFRIYEWYGWTGEPNTGVKLTAGQVAKGIIEREIKWGIQRRVEAGPADSAIWNVESGPSIGDELAEDVRLDDGSVYSGAYFVRADKRPGSRKQGWEAMRSRMLNSIPVPGEVRENPGMYIFDHCIQFLRTVLVLTRSDKDPDDIKENDGEDHIADESRYFIRGTYDGIEESTTVGI